MVFNSTSIPEDINKTSGPQVQKLFQSEGTMIEVVDGGHLVAINSSAQHGTTGSPEHLYSLAFPKDVIYMKIIVYGLYLLELAQSIFIIQNAYQTFVLEFGDIAVFDKIGTGWLSVPIMTTITTSIVQIYYAHRIRRLSESNKVAIVIVVLSLIQLGGGLALGVYAQRAKTYPVLESPQMLLLGGVSTGIWNVGSVICDLIIAVYMTYYLSRYDSSIRQTKEILRKFIRLTIETGTLTTTVGIVCFSLAILPNSPYYYQVAMGILGKIYANSMLVLINSRMILGSNEDQDTVITAPIGFAKTRQSHEGLSQFQPGGNMDEIQSQLRSNAVDLNTTEKA
ncbi:hypothetical protein D9619_012089 [Psilocybe cf. subviscida]|uniref:DUF6534 domain-containing protein n=1 Tax=Psilocybe cf. subviscida TaxID=2480587 RepID=A0A8H5B7S4_9AGAR|nr:hypothetical protein D9619_012089 [Psilocybe cf. subviscida]